MKSLRVNRYGLSVCVAAAMLAGCAAGSSTSLNPSSVRPSAERTRPSVTYGVLYSFAGSGEGDGEIPEATLVNVGGTLYGTTIEGGSNDDGTVFSIAPSGTETVLHSFGGSGDGAYPEAGLLNVNGTLYGTTMEGGANIYGTVFSITPSGKEKVLHGFGASGDGQYPVAGLINVNGTLYGTAADGGADGSGIVFSLTPAGAETVLYSFKGGSADGENPSAGLVNVSGTLYGTTYEGGANADGTAFSITPAGKEKVLHSFVGGPGDGKYPVADLVDVNGKLYGTTEEGGPFCRASHYCGTAFAITTSGKFSLLHSFGSGADGGFPYAGLLNVNGKLYGTTADGGARSAGTIFSMTPSGKEKVLHAFGDSGDGAYPEAGLLNVKDTLYGTTSGAGANNHGTVFSLDL
ncbi:MAG TPA: choice-of-anchor tandem repeat GloVer-containing protein [Candidatus Cybelea sp.]|nr:choice-of-anchor tandem repeat GloVer-containing protein [Candidatus Cybelea sp.]